MGSILKTLLPIELTNGNDGRGSKWFSSAKIRKQVETLLRVEGFEREPFDHPVTDHVTRILGKNQRLWDSSSIGRGNWKEIEDALVAVGWFHDDGPKWIIETRFFQDDSRRSDGPSIEVEVFGEHSVCNAVVMSANETKRLNANECELLGSLLSRAILTNQVWLHRPSEVGRGVVSPVNNWALKTEKRNIYITPDDETIRFLSDDVAG